MNVKILQPGDVTLQGVVDTNHCGLPWPVMSTAEEIVGTICLIPNELSGLNGKSICDAITGFILTEEEIKNRINNYEFDYYKKHNIDRDSVLPKKYIRASNVKS